MPMQSKLLENIQEKLEPERNGSGWYELLSSHSVTYELETARPVAKLMDVSFKARSAIARYIYMAAPTIPLVNLWLSRCHRIGTKLRQILQSKCEA
jgi:hypothetical protein